MDLWSVDIWPYGPVVWTCGIMGLWSSAPSPWAHSMDLWTCRLWTIGPVDQWACGPLDRCPMDPETYGSGAWPVDPSYGIKGLWTYALMGLWTCGPMDM